MKYSILQQRWNRVTGHWVTDLVGSGRVTGSQATESVGSLVKNSDPVPSMSCSILSSCLMFTKSVAVSVEVSNMGVVLIKHRRESRSTVLLGYLTISTNVKCYYRVVYNNFVFQQDSALVHLSFNTVQLMQCKTLNFFSLELWPHNDPELNSTDCEIKSHIAA